MMYEEKLTQQEDEYETEISEMNEKHELDVAQLNEMIANLQSEYDKMKTEKKMADDDKEKEEHLKNNANLDKNNALKVVQEKEDTIRIMQDEQLEVQKTLKKKDRDLYKYKFKIKDLQKSKHVLTHRAKGIYAALEPKEKQIESLKEQILNLEKVFEQQIQTMAQKSEDEQKMKSKIDQLTTELNQQKARSKEKDQTIFKMINDINKYVQSKDEKVYVQGLMQLNQDYVISRSSELNQKKKKDPETVEELDRQLRYMERSMAGMKVHTIKNETRTKNDIKKRTKENTSLINALNILRKEKKGLEDKLQIQNQEIVELKFKLDTKKRNEQASQMKGASKSMSKMKSSESEDVIPSMMHGRPKSGLTIGKQGRAQAKGKVHKGTPFNYRNNQVDEKVVQELQAQLEDNTQVILMQKLEIRSLKEQIIQMVGERDQGTDANDEDDGFLPRVDSKNSMRRT